MAKQAAQIDLSDSFEKIPVKIFPTSQDGSVFVARQVADFIRDKQTKKEKCVLGLATGSSPKSLYAELVRLHQEEKLSFKNVITFNLDEYYPIVTASRGTWEILVNSYELAIRVELSNVISLVLEYMPEPGSLKPI